MGIKQIPIGVLGVSVKEFVEMLEEGFVIDFPQLSDYEINVIIFRLTQILANRQIERKRIKDGVSLR